jgi:hypothetical protein
MKTQTLNQICDDTIAMARAAMLQALENTSWMTTLLVADATRTLNSLEHWLVLQPKFKIEDDVENIPDDAVEWYSESDDDLETLAIPDRVLEWYINAADFWMEKQDCDSINTATPDDDDDDDDDSEDECDEYDEYDEYDEDEEDDDVLEVHSQTMNFELKPVEIDAELEILKGIIEYIRQLPKLKVPTTIKLRPAKIDAELKILDGISEYITHLPKLKIPTTVKVRPANIEPELEMLETLEDWIRRHPRIKIKKQRIDDRAMFMAKTGLGGEQFSEMLSMWYDIGCMMKDFDCCWKRNNFRGSPALDARCKQIEGCWKNFEERFKIKFDREFKKAIREYTPE